MEIAIIIALCVALVLLVTVIVRMNLRFSKRIDDMRDEFVQATRKHTDRIDRELHLVKTVPLEKINTVLELVKTNTDNITRITNQTNDLSKQLRDLEFDRLLSKSDTSGLANNYKDIYETIVEQGSTINKAAVLHSEVGAFPGVVIVEQGSIDTSGPKYPSLWPNAYHDNAHPVSGYLTDKHAETIIEALATGDYTLPAGEVRHVSIDVSSELTARLEEKGYEVKSGKLYTRITKR